MSLCCARSISEIFKHHHWQGTGPFGACGQRMGVDRGRDYLLAQFQLSLVLRSYRIVVYSNGRGRSWLTANCWSSGGGAVLVVVGVVGACGVSVEWRWG